MSRFGEASDSRCEDCGGEEDKDHMLVCDRWENIRRKLGDRQIEPDSEESTIVGYLQKVKPKWF